ncbi:hypothetical protein KI387_012638, partial [Taxus chinensis]
NSRPGRKHLRYGCQCHFSIRVLMKLQDRALITYNKMDHRDDKGKIFHGQETDDFRGSCSLAPHISGALKDWVESFLLLGLTPERTEEHPFVLGLQLPFQHEWMLKYAHKSILSMDSTYGTNEQKFMLYTILAFDNMHNGLLVTWVLMSRATILDLTCWMCKLVVSAHCNMLEWKPNAFIVDDARAEIVAI